MKLMLAIALGLCVQGQMLAQATPKHPEFGVASVKRAASAGLQTAGELRSTDAGSVTVTADRASYLGITLKQLLTIAYDLKPFQISGPDWIETERYDVVATIPTGTPKEAIPAMLRDLLGDRFQINQHSLMKDQPIYLLHIGKTGPKLKPSSSDHAQTVTGFKISVAGNQTDQAEIKFIGETMADFADSLSSRLDRAVTDQTGLPGRFDIALPVDAKDLQPGSASLAASLITDVKNIGLTLDPGKAPTKYLIVDKAEKEPTEN
jgi:uncharacterized protein (TIGR03435 family)